ncbi:MAG TPA: hypothetical protein IAC41_01190 [Candidatus Merdenecus merdavium]|nr:hypothetical protein [Candidatus Merdenecus merdavium]
MEFIKKQSAGFYLTALTVILAIVGLIFYMINCNTAYFSNLGVNAAVVACIVIAVILELVFIIGSETLGAKIYLDILPIVSAVMLMVAFVIFISVRVNNIATILSFERNAQTLADLSSAIIGMGFCFGAAVFSIIASFFKIIKD